MCSRTCTSNAVRARSTSTRAASTLIFSTSESLVPLCYQAGHRANTLAAQSANSEDQCLEARALPGFAKTSILAMVESVAVISQIDTQSGCVEKESRARLYNSAVSHSAAAVEDLVHTRGKTSKKYTKA
jgi:hypothetical protein